MKQPLYVCVTCSQGFTRKSSGKRHNLNIHSGMGCIVRFLDYLVGRVKGQYAAADPLSFRKNKGNNLRPIKSDSLHKAIRSENSDADSVAATEVHDLSSNNRPFVQKPSTDHDFSSLDYYTVLAKRVVEIENLITIKSSTESKYQGIILLPDGTYAIRTHYLLTLQFSNKYIFGYVAYVCPSCAYYAIDQLEFRGGSTDNRIWSIYHKCTIEANATVEERESVGRQYVKVCDDKPFHLELFTRAWLKNSFYVFATKLPYLYYMDRELIEIPDPAEPSKSICICVSSEEIIVLGDNREYWAGRAIANESKPTSISEQEMRDFLRKTEHSTFGIFKIRSAGGKIKYYLIYLGK
jgi:hypothetical protein